MLFRRRVNLSFGQKLRGFLWPRSGLVRTVKYIWHRVARLPGTPHSIAAGFAAGAAVSFTPFLGLHFVMGFAVAWLTRGNMLASAIGTAVGNPWTFPFIFALTGQVGALMLGHDVTAGVPAWSWAELMAEPVHYLSSFLPVVFPLIVGGIPVGIVVWLLFYVSLKGLLIGYHANRQQKLKAKRPQVSG